MASSGLLRSVALVRTVVSEELSASFIRVARIGGLGTTLAVTSIVPSSPNITPCTVLTVQILWREPCTTKCVKTCLSWLFAFIH
jgi:hypothetical protein